MKINDAFLTGDMVLGLRPEVGVINELDAFLAKNSAVEIEAILKLAAEEASSDLYQVKDGIAIIPIQGIITRHFSIMNWLFGGMALSELSTAHESAVQDPEIRGIIFDIDSPGGVVQGIASFADQVYQARDIKPVIAYTGGAMCSAAYWIASAAENIVVDQSAIVGSIGIIAIHSEYSLADRTRGVTRTVLTSGRYKGAGNPAGPLSDDGRDAIQDQLDAHYTTFIQQVARNRGVEVKAVIKGMGEGRDFIGHQAVDAGLADTVGTMLSATLAIKGDGYSFRGQRAETGENTTGATPQTKEDEIMNIAELKEKSPELYNAIHDIGMTDGHALGKVEGHGEGVLSVDLEVVGREAVKDVMALAMVFMGKDVGVKFKSLVDSGVSAEQYQAVSGLVSGGKDDGAGFKADMLKALQASTPEEPGADGGSEGKEAGEDFNAAVRRTQIEDKCSHGKAVRLAIERHPDLHNAYLKGQGVNMERRSRL